MKFPKDFIWGSATSSYQIEGATTQDGRGATIWDTFSDTPGKVLNGDNGDDACDHYNRYREDVALMSYIGLQSYRFSIAWSRILPNGIGKINPLGLDFYDRLVDELLSKNISPLATLYHWDLPQALGDKGGWLNRDIVDAFTEYTNVVTNRLGDRVKSWATHNEPWCISFLSYGIGEHAPGHQNWKEAITAAHYVLLSHGTAVDVIRANVSDAKVGIVLNLNWVDSITDREEDVDAAKRFDGYFNRWFLDPLYKGEYPQDMWDFYGDKVPDVREGDLKHISVPTDFLGINYYSRAYIGAGKDEPFFTRGERTTNEYTAMDWEVYPQGLEQLLVRLHEEYAPKAIYVTENGAAYNDEFSADGKVHDDGRKAYLEAHFEAAASAIAKGVPLRGYYVWSLMDNFEWAWGYSKRFGITYVDFKTGKRTLKQSGEWYRRFIEQQQSQ